VAEAAALLEEQGRFREAADLYQQVWDFPAAMRAARRAGDLPGALRAAIQSKVPAAVEELVAELVRAPSTVARAAAEACEERGAFLPAARLLEASGDLHRSAEDYERAGLCLDAARLCEATGESRRAMDLYRRCLAETTVEPTTFPPGDSSPRYRLGRLLLRYGRAEEALPFLQQVWLEEGRRETPAGRCVAAALARLGYPHAATVALGLMGAAEGAPPPTLESCRAELERSATTPMESDEPLLAGRYRLGKLLGSGGMGRVYLALDLLTDRQVAVKVFAAPTGARGRDAYRRFVREAKTTGQLQHPHIVSLLDFNEEMGFMVLEYMGGGSLGERLRPAVDLASCRSVLLQVLSGLAAAHQRGIVHRDLKPSNIFFSESGAAKLGDFGVAHLQDSGQTMTGAFVGTVAFMSPEQIVGARIGFATDLYALGVTFFLMVTGQLPFTPPDLISKHLSAPPPRPSDLAPGLPPICDEVVQRCMAKAPEDRYDSLDTLRRALESIPADAPAELSAPGTGPAFQERQRRAADARFTVESAVVDRPEAQIFEAQDNQLGRAVMLVRLAPGVHREPLLELLAAAAAAGDEHLQRVFALERERGQAVLDPAMGEPVVLPLPAEAERIALAEQLGLALAPLHRCALAHGAVTASALTRRGGCFVLSLLPALTSRETASPSTDVLAVLGLAGLSPRVEILDGAALAEWAKQEGVRLASTVGERRRHEVLERALRQAPPEVRRG
jgi:serine/threonine-protein kinase